VHLFTVPENGGKARAQTQALEHFRLLERYDYIIFLDGDSKVVPRFFTALFEAAVKQSEVSLFVGQIKSVPNSHVFSAYRAYEYTFSHDLAKEAQSNFNVIYVSPGCASMYRTDVLGKLHIDHLTLAEDMDLTIQVHRLGGKVVYLSEAAVMTQDPSTLRDYHKQILRWYRGFWQVVKKHEVIRWWPRGPVDLYMWMIILDAVVFNRVFCLVALLSLWPNITVRAFGLDILVAFGVACWAARRTGRKDVIYKFPIYYWFSYFNLYAFVRSFVEIIVLKKELLAWNKVKRYQFDDPITASTN
jgi:cellulose synthase/poly-beta-1,6-N-acetylglucosamine synthase-like glycosyltransferase